jgi:hypothetical protein
VNRHSLAVICLAASVILGSGCGQSAAQPEKVGSSAEAGPNSRLKYKDEYKKMLDNKGQLRWKPTESSRRPEGIPKS